ncbi:hypothetical protein [Singulisphaera sp. PoT]|uniref:hypothetical protein n=1 Tax=Singulisphaera sp. PoT TaxID=3411797 RepID=UPI003BF57B1C
MFLHRVRAIKAGLLLAALIGAACGALRSESANPGTPQRAAGSFAVGHAEAIGPHLVHTGTVPAVVHSDEPIDRLDDDDDRWKLLKTVQYAQDFIPLDLACPPSSTPREWRPSGSTSETLQLHLRC